VGAETDLPPNVRASRPADDRHRCSGTPPNRATRTSRSIDGYLLLVSLRGPPPSGPALDVVVQVGVLGPRARRRGNFTTSM
jgi:hypothetical protein